MQTTNIPGMTARPSFPSPHPTPAGTLSNAEIRRIILDVLG